MKRILLAMLMFSSSALSDVKFSITGTANETKYGCISGQSYTFDFVVNENYSGGNGNIYSVSSSENHWSQNISADLNIFSDAYFLKAGVYEGKKHKEVSTIADTC